MVWGGVRATWVQPRGMGQGEIRDIEIIFAGNPHQRKQRIAAGVRQGRSHPMRAGRLANRTDRPVRGDPFAGRMRQRCCQSDQPGRIVDRSRLDCSNLMPPQ